MEWENSTSKLYYIKPRIEEWGNAHNSCRKYEAKLADSILDTRD